MIARKLRELAVPAAVGAAAACFYNPSGSKHGGPDTETSGASTTGAGTEAGTGESTDSSMPSTGSSGCDSECTTAPGMSSTGATTSCTTDCPALTCGDGQVDGAEGEECDDGNDVENDGCNSWCRLPRRVFVSSETVVGGTIGGFEAADASCTSMANAAGLAGAFKAWLSDDDSSPATRFDVAFKGAYLLPNDTAVVVAGWDDLTDGTLAAPIKITEMGTTVTDMYQYAWTGTRTTGEADGLDCSGWTDTEPGTEGIAGSILAVDMKWTKHTTPLACPALWRLYCFEDPAP